MLELLPFEVGALYNRRTQIHDLLGGQRQGGISTPTGFPIVIIFTGEAGKTHGYRDYWDDEGTFHYYGEGQKGDMRYIAGNLAIEQHQENGKKLIAFQSMGKGQPYRYLGEFVRVDSYYDEDAGSTAGAHRRAIVFRLAPINEGSFFSALRIQEPSSVEIAMGSTSALKLTEVRKKQSLFRHRLLGIEKGCRLTGIEDLRFLRASHIKPWAACATGNERIDGHNGVLLTPHADALFDRGWITFENKGSLVVTSDLPPDVRKRIGLNLRPGRRCGSFSERQQSYLEYHRNQVFEQRYKKSVDPLSDLLADIPTG